MTQIQRWDDQQSEIIRYVDKHGKLHIVSIFIII